MAIIKSYLLPHSPLLIPEIGKANHSLMQKTVTIYENIKAELKASKINSIVIITPHGHEQTDNFLLNCSPDLDINFQDFGFIPPKTIIKGDILLADQIKNALQEDFPLKQISKLSLDYGSGIPLYLLKEQNQDFKALTINPATNLDLEIQVAFGEKLFPILENNQKRIAVIASGDLSHRLMRKSPGGYSPKGPKFDNKVIEYLSYPETAINNLLNLDKHLILAASECGLKPILMLLGILNTKNWEPDILAYQTDFGVGYLSLEFILPANNTLT
ncbi:MAG: hypothetical protein PWQ35_255 [Patescibacteria group bacterium]|nr:hypothetical protein [Patescibacteria group bacterium]